MVLQNSAEQRPPGHNQDITDEWLANVIVSTLFSFIGFLVICFRLLVVLLRRRSFGSDDVAIYLACIANVGFSTASWVSLRWGVGMHMSELPQWWAINALKAVYVVEIFYYLSLFLIKMSLMFLYLRIAKGLLNAFRTGTIITMTIIIAHFISTVVVMSLQCMPMEKYWDPTVPGKCTNITAFFYSTNTFTIVSDCVIIALPVSTFWKLNQPGIQKLGLMAVFLVGALSTIASCIRLYSIRIYTQSPEPIKDAAPISTWSFVEINLGILCASAPAIKPLFMSGGKNNRDMTSSDTSYYNNSSERSNRSIGLKRPRLKRGRSYLTELSTLSSTQVPTRKQLQDIEISPPQPVVEPSLPSKAVEAPRPAKLQKKPSFEQTTKPTRRPSVQFAKQHMTSGEDDERPAPLQRPPPRPYVTVSGMNDNPSAKSSHGTHSGHAVHGYDNSKILLANSRSYTGSTGPGQSWRKIV